MLDSLYLHSYGKQIAHKLINGTTELEFVQLVFKFLVTCLWEIVSYHPQHPFYSLTLFKCGQGLKILPHRNIVGGNEWKRLRKASISNMMLAA